MAKIRIKQVAKQKGISMTDIFYATGIAESTLSRINNGKQSPSVDMLERIAECLKVSVSELIVMEENWLECPHCHKLIKVNLQK